MSDKKMVILLVEDDAFLLNMYATKFEVDGYEVLLASDGEAAVRIALEAEKLDVILLDVQLPKMDGFGVIEILKKNERTKSVPIILLTNMNQKDDLERGMSLGADDYLIKAHFMPSEVIEKVRKVLK